jgi:hypothetical protein
LMEQQSVLKLDDYNYLISNGGFSGVKSWAKEQIKALTGEIVEDAQAAPAGKIRKRDAKMAKGMI